MEPKKFNDGLLHCITMQNLTSSSEKALSVNVIPSSVYRSAQFLSIHCVEQVFLICVIHSVPTH